LSSFEADQVQPGLQRTSERGGLPIRKFTVSTGRRADRRLGYFSASYCRWELEKAGQDSDPKNVAQHFEGVHGSSWHSPNHKYHFSWTFLSGVIAPLGIMTSQ